MIEIKKFGACILVAVALVAVIGGCIAGIIYGLAMYPLVTAPIIVTLAFAILLYREGGDKELELIRDLNPWRKEYEE